MPKPPELFKSEMIPAPSGSGRLFEERLVPNTSPITCLGKTFASDEERRTYFTGILREKLSCPDFRNIEGFPIGKDEDILALSDPPYYTACPNPWLQDFIDEWESEKAQDPLRDNAPYHREPFAADVSEGKNDPIYNAHSYHTKVPHKAIMRYILHYTEPGDIVFDGFCGTGMTGVAAQMCGNRAEVESLGYRVKDDGTILQEEADEKGVKTWKPFSRLGARKAVLNDLSPAATFIAYNYNTPVDTAAFEREAKRILAEVEAECGWMYETLHTDGKTKGKINYTVWSDVFICPQCSKELVFWEAAVDKTTWQVNENFECPYCDKKIEKKYLERLWVTNYNEQSGAISKLAKQIPVLIHYKISNNTYTKIPDKHDLEQIEKIEKINIPYWYPVDSIPNGDKMSDPKAVGIRIVSEFYTKRSLYIMAKYLDLVKKRVSNNRLIINLTSSAIVLSRQYRFRSQGGSLGAGGGPMNGTLYVPSLFKEIPVTKVIGQHIERMTNVLLKLNNQTNITQITSLSCITYLSDNSIDYIFIDPPFGYNIMYSELNYIWESWLKIKTNNKEEAIENHHQKKSGSDYRVLMTRCFREVFRVLKPGRWVTVEFSNTKAYIWNNIQTALYDANFIIANVSALDKKQGSYNSVNNPTSVKQDLVISAYKPNGGFEQRFIQEADTEEGVWDFVRTHLGYLPVVKVQGEEILPVDERQARILFDHVVAFYVRKGKEIPIPSSQAFQAGLKQRFDKRDGMYFLPAQVLEYDKKKLVSNGLKPQELFVLNEETAILWLKSILTEKSQTIQDIYPEYMQRLSGFAKTEERMELKILLEQNFLQDESGTWRVPDPEKAADIEKLREKALLKEFETYKSAAKKLKIFRMEAIRAGFKKAYNAHDYETIINTAGKLPADSIEEDPVLLMYYTSAQTRMGE